MKSTTGRTELELALAESERRFRMLASHSSDIVVESGADGLVRWVSPSVEKVLGVRPESWLGKRPRDLVHPDDRDLLVELHDELVEHGVHRGAVELRVVTAAGDSRWMELLGQRIVQDGLPIGIVGGLRDVHDQVLLRRALTTLSAANAAMVRANSEQELLDEMCALAVEKAGYLFAFYARRVSDEAHSVQNIAAAEQHRGYLDEIRLSWGDDEFGQGPTGRCLREETPQCLEDFVVAERFRPWLAAATRRGFRSSLSIPVFVDGVFDGAFMVYAPEPYAFDAQAVAVLTDLAAQMGTGLARVRVAAHLQRAADERRLLTTAIDQAAEAIVVTDNEAIIRYANPAALRVSGYTLEEVLGQNPNIFQSGMHDDRFYGDMWTQLMAGEPWHGVLLNRRKNGEFYEEEATIAPVHDEDGRRIAYVAVKHDLTKERQLQEAVDRDQLDRDAIVEVMRDVHPGETLFESAEHLATAVRRFADVDGCMVIVLRPDGQAIPVAISGPVLPGFHQIGEPLHNDRIDLMVEISKAGPWWMDFRDEDGIAATDPEFSGAMRAAGFTSTAYAPIRWGGETIGVVSVGTFSPTAEVWMPQRMGLLTEVGSFAGMLLGSQAVRHTHRELLRAEIEQVIAEERFQITFEPVIHLPSGAAVGYEALTRFDDGTTPELRFGDALAVGLGSELEAACAGAALREAASLPASAWVAVNFSPTTIVAGVAAAVVAGTTRQVIIEITEHDHIENYQEVRRAIAAAGNVLVAVDDAGSGFASLRHILELEPDIIKLDLALVRDIDSDPARQALAAGMRHFAALTGTTLIAEGVETEAEAKAIRQLGVEMAQGYVFREPPTPS
ncbi:MAG: PAS domain S-box protein [Ilumatobacteraceae bacterium]